MERNWWSLRGAERHRLKLATETQPVEVTEDGRGHVIGRWKMKVFTAAQRDWAMLAVQCSDHRALARTLKVTRLGDTLTLTTRAGRRYTIDATASPTDTELLLETIHGESKS